jgi:hypothetical protein
LQRACLALIDEHKRDGALPTSIRFLFYELVGRGAIAKSNPNRRRRPDTYVSEALMVLREAGLVPWSWIVDETRSVTDWQSAANVAEYLVDTIELARIDPWAGAPAPLLICESRSLSGALRNLASDYLVPITSSNGQSGGFLVTDVAPLMVTGRRVLYLGDFDLSGGHIEANTRRTLSKHAPVQVRDWERLALTAEQVDRYQLPVIQKYDKRVKRYHDAVETEALSQRVIVDLVRTRLDELLPEPLDLVRERERRERVLVQERLRGLAGEA